MNLLVDSIKGKKLKKESYIKADKLFYFNIKKMNYFILGRIDENVLNELLRLILLLSNENKLIKVSNNL